MTLSNLFFSNFILYSYIYMILRGISSEAAELYFFSQNNSLAWRTEALPNNFGTLAKDTIPYFEKLFLFIMHRNCAITMHFPPKILSFFRAHVNIWCKNLSKNLISYFDSGIFKNAPASHPLVEIELFHLQIKIATVSCKNCKTKKYQIISRLKKRSRLEI